MQRLELFLTDNSKLYWNHIAAPTLTPTQYTTTLLPSDQSFLTFEIVTTKIKNKRFLAFSANLIFLKLTYVYVFTCFFLPLVKPRMPSYSMLDIQRYKIPGKSAFKNVFLSRNFETLSLIPCQLASSQGIEHIISQIFRLWHRYLFYEAYF